MIKVSVLYPNQPGRSFDMDYYVGKHIPMVKRLLGDACKGIAVEQGMAGGALGAPATYAAMGHLYFDSVDASQSSFGANAAETLADVPNYAQVEPVVQISEVKL